MRILIYGAFALLAAVAMVLVAGYFSPGLVEGDGTVSTPVILAEVVLERGTGYSLSHIAYSYGEGEVCGLLAMPDSAFCGVVFAPGAGILKEAHANRAARMAGEGIAFFVLDIRGNGGETQGVPFDPEKEYAAYLEGGLPQTYAVTRDISAARSILEERAGVPVLAAGSSMGGRYAILAASSDVQFAGAIGVSTSGFDRVGELYEGQAREFLLSIDPDNAVADISPRPVWILHSPRDAIIPIEEGRRLYESARDPKSFVEFNGTHGINGEVDEWLVSECMHLYGRAGNWY